MRHEEAVKKVHSGAREFKPVRNLLRVVIGWTFEVPSLAKNGERIGASVDYGWVTAEAEVSSDKLSTEWRAERNLKAYRSAQRHRPMSELDNRI